MQAPMKSRSNKPLRLEDFECLFCTWEGGYKLWGWHEQTCYLLMES